MLQESAAVRVATLGVALLTAFAVCSAADKEIKIKILITATWRVSCHKLNCLPKLLMSQVMLSYVLRLELHVSWRKNPMTSHHVTGGAPCRRLHIRLWHA